MWAELSKAVSDWKVAREVPPFRATGPRYDMSSFVGRTLHFYSVNDPLTLLTTRRDAMTIH